MFSINSDQGLHLQASKKIDGETLSNIIIAQKPVTVFHQHGFDKHIFLYQNMFQLLRIFNFLLFVCVYVCVCVCVCVCMCVRACGMRVRVRVRACKFIHLQGFFCLECL